MKPPKSNTKNRKEAASSSYLAEDENFQKFATQLAPLGLELRDITGDGNCCFRALSDQMHGTEAHHIEYRKRVCQYMRQSREEFEPFVAALIDDEEPSGESGAGGGAADTGRRMKFLSKKLDAYEKYIKNLEQPGTYADNGCLVAFARLYQVNINIHQLNMPIWTISGVTAGKNRPPARELHLSYHNGEHYSSIRPIGDRTNTPTNISIMNNNDSGGPRNRKDCKNKPKSGSSAASNYYVDDDFEYHEYSDGFIDQDFNDKVEEIIEITKCMDINLIKDKLVENNFDTEMTINYFIGQNVGNERPSKPVKGSEKKMEKKMRQMERQRLKVMEQQQSKQAPSKTASSSVNDQLFQQPDDMTISISNIETKSI